jgi:aspartyl aminopeptidase
MTDSASGSILRLIAKKAGVPIQEFVVRNDTRCGSTIGSMMAAKLGVKTVDIGAG